jgi:hypothetical protein
MNRTEFEPSISDRQPADRASPARNTGSAELFSKLFTDAFRNAKSRAEDSARPLPAAPEFPATRDPVRRGSPDFDRRTSSSPGSSGTVPVRSEKLSETLETRASARVDRTPAETSPVNETRGVADADASAAAVESAEGRQGESAEEPSNAAFDVRETGLDSAVILTASPVAPTAGPRDATALEQVPETGSLIVDHVVVFPGAPSKESPAPDSIPGGHAAGSTPLPAPTINVEPVTTSADGFELGFGFERPSLPESLLDSLKPVATPSDGPLPAVSVDSPVDGTVTGASVTGPSLITTSLSAAAGMTTLAPVNDVAEIVPVSSEHQTAGPTVTASLTGAVRANFADFAAAPSRSAPVTNPARTDANPLGSPIPTDGAFSELLPKGMAPGISSAAFEDVVAPPNGTIDPVVQGSSAPLEWRPGELSVSGDGGTEALPALGLTPERTARATSSADASTSTLARTDRAEFVRRITEALEAARTRMPEKVEFEMSPPELGKVRVSVTTGPEGLAARIEAAVPETRQLLREQLPELERHLRNQGLTAPKVEVAATANPADSGDASRSGGEAGSSLADRGRSSARQDNPPDERWVRRRRETEPAVDFRRPVPVSDLLGSVRGVDRTV